MSSVAVVTGSCGLVGSEVARVFSGAGLDVVGIDNDLRARFFGETASTRPVAADLRAAVPGYRHHHIDIRDRAALGTLFAVLGNQVAVVVHAAGQPSHDWSAAHPAIDFAVNAVGTQNLLDCALASCPEAVFIFISTNKVYGDTPNALPLREGGTRWQIDPAHAYADGIDEEMRIDRSVHSPFGVSKAAADLLTQEYGHYYGLRSVVLRPGCITGPGHRSVFLHGFLSHLAASAVAGERYLILGYRGKQVRDNLHTADLAQALLQVVGDPRAGGVYNIGGGSYANCSIIEAAGMLERLLGRPVDTVYEDTPRKGDHIWWVSGLQRFRTHYPAWQPRYDTEALLGELVEYHKKLAR